ncbi:MAG: UDP-N-acetylmuramoyl-L-alanyl-D-glutamate--2,6-diaminopimelate ligase [Planctomycetota bacterium]|nr:UDP-N-acetylmuramoyl-L-alanyl-D-glutamate--2,6-diaminopimelate ligase [Planctomycetota bacterium]MDG2143293.1 UDP-N-acetylmuramoyl-L-alanyl-D-glutamate--2,6-diaminopimelate ligase [Planctomycetota bacterium]
MVRLSDLVKRFGGKLSQDSASGWAGDPVVSSVELDSRKITGGSLFAALSGGKDNGADYAQAALGHGASAVLSSTTPGFGWQGDRCSALWLHSQPRRVAGLAAGFLHGSPSLEQFTVGVTGTNGKTTVAWIVHALLEKLGRKNSLFGTVEHRPFGGESVFEGMTTPDAPYLHRALSEAKAAGGNSAVLEVSSHAIDQERCAGIFFDVGILTNLTRDHLDYHGDLESYIAVKERFFASLGTQATAIINNDCNYANRMASAARNGGAKVVTYSIGSRADLVASQLKVGPLGTQFVLQGMGTTSFDLTMPLVGRHNVENALAALAVMLLLEASPSVIAEGLASISPTPGRLEPVAPALLANRGFSVLVDFAHTPSALENVLTALRNTDPARIICVFGCGGDRDRGKRPEMGRVVGSLADVAVLTSDNPRSEEPSAIMDETEAGMAGGNAELHREVDRRAAIELALSLGQTGDVVLIAGKGHEAQQVFENHSIPFDDRQVAEELLS